MTDENIQNLLGGFATGTLTDQERQLLFTAALKDQELFNALADEEVLREFLSDPASRRRLLELLQPTTPGIFERLTSWMRRPVSWGVAGAAVAVLIAVILIRDSRPPTIDMVRTAPPASPALAPPAAQAPAPMPSENRAMARQDAPSLVMKREAAPAPKMKVAVLEFDSGPAPAKESEAKKADLGKTASDLLGKKLDLDGYAVIDRKQVVKAMQAQKLNERQLTPVVAAGLGRSLGADAVIVGTVKPSMVMSFNDAAVARARPEAAAARAKSAASETVEVTATAINTQNAVSLAYAQTGQTQAGGLAGAVDQVASSLGQQIQQNTQNALNTQNAQNSQSARIKIEGLVTDVNAKIITLNVGVQAGVRVGDRLEIRRAGKPIGRVVVNSVQDTFSVGLFDGPDPVKIGDLVANP